MSYYLWLLNPDSWKHALSGSRTSVRVVYACFPAAGPCPGEIQTGLVSTTQKTSPTVVTKTIWVQMLRDDVKIWKIVAPSVTASDKVRLAVLPL